MQTRLSAKLLLSWTKKEKSNILDEGISIKGGAEIYSWLSNSQTWTLMGNRLDGTQGEIYQSMHQQLKGNGKK